jgi:hypothetical protein
MLKTGAIGRAVLVLALVAGGCSFKDKGIDTTHVLDDDGGGAGTGGGTTGTGGGKATGGSFGTGGARLDGSIPGDALSPPPPPPSDASLPDLGPDAPAQPPGTACATDGMCGSGFCVDGVCCDQRCGDPCFSCNGMGTAGQCKPDVASTVCGAASCMGATHTPAPRCDGNGACKPAMAAPCAGNLTCANETTCRTKCAASGECTGGMVCDVASGACHAPGKANGQACMTGAECGTGNCADGVCCDLQCTGLCRACVMAQTGKPDGTCANVKDGVKDARCVAQEPSTCGRDGTCDGQGACSHYANGTRCATECCRDSSGPGGGEPRVCAFQCQSGACDRAHPTTLDRCGGAQCCCPTGAPGGGPACTGVLGCPLNTCVQ